ncbi:MULTISPECIES: polysaccharide deacetylase family protein [Gluconobacter]|uniref:Chitooligosaccharide deacetylase n=1 Tax=Gluconobacter cadivus TaxID=2728101 RepID=A0ABR9YW80_9PROT|nr:MULTISPECIES: polysaccharide deacetylase [Gluconobacter]MBF0888792.1 polysaccharide deacetylase [Gluconobacter cadivus]MBS1059854.1 polysaccharide deacetylase [Gluconobacter sp. Dm-44]
MIRSYDDVPIRPSNLAGPAPEFPWPHGMRAAMMLSFDIDAESAITSKDPSHADKLVSMSYGGYEARVGLPKVLELLRELDLKATFFTTGWAADAYPSMVESVLRDGHEVGHHGYHHLLPDPGSAHIEDELARGFEALAKQGVRPVGYRAPYGESCDELRTALKREGMLYSSSWRDDVRPYRQVLPDLTPGVVELPPSSCFDDWMHGLSTRFGARSIFPKEHVLSMWKDELDETRAWGAMVGTVLHPLVSGRPMRLRLLRNFLFYTIECRDVWIATGEQIARHFEACEAAGSTAP